MHAHIITERFRDSREAKCKSHIKFVCIQQHLQMKRLWPNAAWLLINLDQHVVMKLASVQSAVNLDYFWKL